VTDASDRSPEERARDGWPALLAAYATESVASVAAFAPTLDLSYGPHPRQRFDLYRAVGPRRGTLAYFHAGFWQSRDKADFRFLAPAFAAEGLDVAMVNYPLCPDVTLRQVVEAARQAVPAILAQAPGPLIVAGHSAGGHLAVELALSDLDRAERRIDGIVAVSGVYDLPPLIGTPLNDRLQLDIAEARALSPLSRLRPGLPPAVSTFGGLEPADFREGSAAAHASWAAEGAGCRLFPVDQADHFCILREFTDPASALHTAILALSSAPFKGLGTV
jgi:arylformamidase